MKTITPGADTKLSAAQLKKLVTRGYGLHRKMAGLKREFDAIKKALKDHAIANPEEWVELEDDKRDGERWIGRGAACECRVVLPSSKLDATFAADSAEVRSLRKVLGKLFPTLFRPVKQYVPKVGRETFLETVSGFLPAKKAAAVMDLCLKDSEARVTWHGITTSGRNA